MNIPPLVSVVVPNYNYKRYLDLRIQSILQQTFQDFELILLDDASTDGSDESLLAYQGHEKVSRVVINRTNTGNPFQQWFKGIRLARGKYVWIAEADDLCEPTFLEKLVPLLEQHPRAAVAFAGSNDIDAEGRILKQDTYCLQHRKAGFTRFNGQIYAIRNLYWRNYIANASAVLFRKSMVNLDRMQSCLSLRHSGDWLFWFYLSQQGDIIECYEVLNGFRQHTQKVTVKAENNGRGKSEDIEIVQLMEQHLPVFSRYKRSLRRGMLYNRISKLSASDAVKQLLWDELKQKLNGSRLDGRWERLNRVVRLFCPFVLTMKRERLSPAVARLGTIQSVLSPSLPDRYKEFPCDGTTVRERAPFSPAVG